MIRKAIIAVLTLAAMSTGILMLSVSRRPVFWDGSRLQGRWLYAVIDDGRVMISYSEAGTVPLPEEGFKTRIARILVESNAEMCQKEVALVRQFLKEHGLGVPSTYVDQCIGESRDQALAVLLRLIADDDFLYFGSTTPHRALILRFPLWTPLLFFCAYPTAALVYRVVQGQRRRKRGLCIRCGYNLQGNVSGVCSECGEAR